MMSRSFLLSLVAASSLFAAPQKAKEDKGLCCTYMPPDSALSDQMMPTYNRQARIDVDGYDIFMDLSFIYWNVGQDYMEVGRSAQFTTLDADVTTATPAARATVPTPSFEYQPGFKIGFGHGSTFDNWEIGAEYTYLRYTQSLHVGSHATSFATGAEIFIPNEWYVNLGTNLQAQAAHMESKWRMNLDLIDVTLSRPFYQGQRLNFKPYAGLRSLLIRQSYQVRSILATNPTGSEVISKNRSQGWSIGPNVGADFNFLLGSGFRLEFDTGMSLLYMSYTKQSHSETFAPGQADSAVPLNGSEPTRGVLRPINELGLGFGWGTYAYNQKYHFDFSARYDFMILWSQNMMRKTLGALANNDLGYSNPIGDLNLHGLTITGRFDF